jgi:hypothetical protein
MPKTSRSYGRKAPSQAEDTEEASPAATSVKPLYRSKELSPRARVIALAFGDALCFFIFVTIGANQHNEGVNLLYNLWLALPFVAAWFLVSPLVGAFREDIATMPRKMLTRTLLAWLATWPVAMGFRWLLVDRVKVPPVSFSSFLSFALVTLFFNMVLLTVWRWPFALNNSLRKNNS